jgi:hypothetical protein
MGIRNFINFLNKCFPKSIIDLNNSSSKFIYDDIFLEQNYIFHKFINHNIFEQIDKEIKEIQKNFQAKENLNLCKKNIKTSC